MANAFQQEQERPEFEMISELAENLVLRLPRCEDVMIRKTIQDVFRDFCRETKCLTAERWIDLERGRADYPLFSVFGGLVTDVRAVSIGPRRLKPGWDYSTNGANPVMVVLSRRWVGGFPHPPHRPPPDGMVFPVPTPGEFEKPFCVPPAEAHIHLHPRRMRVLQEEMPSLNSEKVPRGFIERYGEAICSGVMFRLCSMVGRSWSDANVAVLERINYENAKSEERMRRETPPGGRFIDTSQVL
ncbi:MAG: hypothetical protein ACI4RA_03520 [Kiritimatiellia bacterium]